MAEQDKMAADLCPPRCLNNLARRNRSVQDMPECFSRPICALAMQLNDEAGDGKRQLLLPSVTLLVCTHSSHISVIAACRGDDIQS
jgi:hypothetical protein